VKILLEKLQEQQLDLNVLENTLSTVFSTQKEVLIQVPQNELVQLVKVLIEKVPLHTHTSVPVGPKCYTDVYTCIPSTELQRKHQDEIKSLMENFQGADAHLEGNAEILSAQFQAFCKLQRRLEENVMMRDLQVNIQAQGSPGAFWEQELESLLIVIDLKNEVFREQSRKLAQMEQLMERNRSLEDQLSRVLQQNEDLLVRMEKSQTLNKWLSRGRGSL
ncbi:coiled-coil domain-containing protein 69-like, partial [Arapaima gigas]